MTIQLIPGDPNRSIDCLSQTRWRNHHIIAYGSGNNLIILTRTDGNKSIQTIYLEKDPISIDINSKTGIICISSGTLIIVLKPVNEYMSIPKWTEALRINNDNSEVLCLKWSTDEDELAVGSTDFLSLYHVFEEYGEIRYSRRWHMKQANPTEHLDITKAADKIVTYNSSTFDSFAKMWQRINYGDSNTLFELDFLQHDADVWLTGIQWRPSNYDREDDIHAMAHIKNLRTIIRNDDSNDVLYTRTSDNKLHVWATFDYSGHSHIKRWTLLSLIDKLTSNYVTSLIIDNHSLQLSLVPVLESIRTNNNITKALNSVDLRLSDILLVWGSNGELVIHAISNIDENPPNSVNLIYIMTIECNRHCIPNYSTGKALLAAKNEPVTLDAFQIASNPIIASHFVCAKEFFQFLIHDRIKNTVRYNEISITKLLEKPNKAVALKSKYQGHAKSIQKLITSTSSFEGNILLSILGYPEHNYIWEPLLLEPENQKFMSITKRFRLNVTRDDSDDADQGIQDAILINDIESTKGPLRHHLAFVIEKGGYASLWDCDGVTMDDKDAELIDRQEILDDQNDKIRTAPLAFSLHEIAPNVHGIIAIFQHDLIKAWKVTIDNGNISISYLDAQNLPGEYKGHCQVSAVDTYLEKDISAIDERGVFRSLSPVFSEKSGSFAWSQNIQIHTRIPKSSNIHGASLIKKLALVDESGYELTIWDTQSGLLEYKEVFPEKFGKVRDLDWTFTGASHESTNAILSVGFSRFVLLYTELRYDYTNRIPTFAVLKKIDISEFTSHEIADLIWIDDGYLAIACGNQFFIDDKWVNLTDSSTSSASKSINDTIKQLMIGYNAEPTSYLVSDLVRILNGPLPLYHPQFLIQALFNNEVKLVEEILVRLLQVLRADEPVKWNLDFNFLEAIIPEKKPKLRRRLSQIDGLINGQVEIFSVFNDVVLNLLVEKLTKVSLPLLTRHQQITLTNVVTIVNDLSQFKGSMDENGLKFLLAFKLFQTSLKQSRLSMRDISWALHSDQKEMLFSHVDTVYHGQMSWENVKQTGLTRWADINRLISIVESVARNEFGNSRDPSGLVSVLFLAIKKKQVLLGLWRTVFHPEKDKVLKFMSNDFTEKRWQTAALKNAFVLLGRHRYMDAAYFFLLAGLVKDCCITLCNKLDEVELALAVSRVNKAEEVTMHIIENYILPQALLKGDRWMTSWVFWQLRLKEISVQALIKSPRSVVKKNLGHFSDAFKKDFQEMKFQAQSKSFLRDDPLLAVMFDKLRASKLNYLEGSRAVTQEEEFDFVIKVSSIYSRMGCDYLGLLLVRNWKFLNPLNQSLNTKQSLNGKDLFQEFSGPTSDSKLQADSAAFQEPDMSAFSFGF